MVKVTKTFLQCINSFLQAEPPNTDVVEYLFVTSQKSENSESVHVKW